VRADGDGSVTVALRELADAAQLKQALAANGVPALLHFGGGPCSADRAPQRGPIGLARIREAGGHLTFTMTFKVSRWPAGSELYIANGPLGRKWRSFRRGTTRAARRPAPEAPQVSATGSAGRPPEQLVDTAALALGRTARAAVPGRHWDSLLARRWGRAVVDVAPGGDRCADALGDDLLDDHDAFTSFVAQPHLVPGPYGMRGLDPDPVDPDVSGPAGTGRSRTGRG
jgi:hypothetical protein